VAGAQAHRIGVWATAGAVEQRSTAGVTADGLFRIKGAFVLSGHLEVGGWWEDLGPQMDVDGSPSFVVAGPTSRIGVAAGFATQPEDADTQLYVVFGAGPAAWRMAERDRLDLLTTGAETSPGTDPAGWFTLVPYARATLDLPLTDLVALVASYELTVHRQIAAIVASTLTGAEQGHRDPHLTSLRNRWQVGMSIQPRGPIGFSVGVAPVLGHDVVDGEGAQAPYAGIEFLVGAWFVI
jgi:hypothetical protein